MRQLAWLLSATSIAALFARPTTALAQSPRVILDEQFASLDPARWMEATNGPWQVGAPTIWSLSNIQGRNVLRAMSELDGPMRRGFLTIPTFRVRSTLIEFDVLPVSSQGSPAEALLLFPFGDVYLAMSLHATPAGGPAWVRVETAGWADTFPMAAPWQPGRWHTFVMDVGVRRVRLVVRDDASSEIWAMDFPWELCDYSSEWGVGVLQHASPGQAVVADAAFDRVTVMWRCGADIDGDGRLTVNDFVRFINEHANRDCSADMNDDHAADSLDFVAFAQAFAAGCM
ncbi:MAG: GC-type dockerin domain-anchored protein [Phycisphaerales bacterium]